MNKSLVTLSCMVALAAVLDAQTSTDRGRTASPAELATGYRELVQINDLLRAVEGGTTLHLGERVVTRDNLEQFRAEFTERMASLTAAITERGYATISGAYDAKVGSACKGLPSGWTGSIGGGAVSKITITQNGFEVVLVHDFIIEGTAGTFEIKGVVVDSILAFDDMMNSDFGFIGQVGGGALTVRPQADEILAAWPSWVKAPSRKDLSRCEVKLSRHTS